MLLGGIACCEKRQAGAHVVEALAGLMIEEAQMSLNNARECVVEVVLPKRRIREVRRILLLQVEVEVTLVVSRFLGVQTEWGGMRFFGGSPRTCLRCLTPH